MAGSAASTVLVFGDQSVSTHSFYRELFARSKGNTYANAFLEQAYAALRHEVQGLPASHRRSIPHFSSILELSSRSKASVASHAGVDGALLVVAQLTHYISASELTSWSSSSSSSSSSNTQPMLLVGMCTGALAAAAVASRPAPGDLILVGVEAVRLAFRAGIKVQEAANNLEGASLATDSWSYLVPDLSQQQVQELLDSFSSRRTLVATKSAYVSAVGGNTVTISGPPSTLKALFSDPATFGSRKKVPLAIRAPYHAPHLHSSVESIISSECPILDSIVPENALLSAKTGEKFRALSARELFSAVLDEMLRQPLNLDKVIDSIAASPALLASERVELSGLGPVNVISSMMSVIKQKAAKDVVAGPHAEWIQASKIQKTPSLKNASGAKLAIVGMSGRFPSSGDHNKFWDLLMNGVDAHRPIPPDRFDANLYYDAAGKIRNTSHTPYGNFINDPGMFDPRFFNLSPREAAQTDPMQRLALVTAYEALEMSGYVPNRTSATQLDRIGTYYGQTSDDWREINAAQDVDTYFITGGVRAFGPGRINYTFKFSGPSFSVDTACSSSMAAIQIACTALRAGECDTAVAGGVSVLTNPDIFSGLSRGQFLSKTGNCQTFDNDADGYCRADAVGTVVIKRLEDAQADNDDILAVILNSATNHSAEAVSITHPHAGTQEVLYRKILDDAGVDALDVDYVEMHGTGTQAGDDTEMRSVTNVFAPANRKRRADQQLYLGSVKANVGHGEAASGITALIKCLMMLERNKIPPHVGIKKNINVNFPKDLDARGVNIALGGSRDFLPRQDRRRIVYVNNFSAAGGNTGLLMEEAPERKPVKADPRSTHVISITAKAKPSLKNNVERYLRYLDEHPETRLEDLAYTLTARRIQHNYRIVFQASSMEQARKEMLAAVERQTTPLPTAKPTLGFLFTGQGAVYASLGRDAYLHEPRFRHDIHTFDSMATHLGLPSFLSVVDGSMTDIATGSATVVQLAITAVQMALTNLWTSWGVEPDFVTGHSLGEYAALYAAGVISAIDTIYLVGGRAQLLEKHCTAGSHAMLSVKAERNIIETLPADLSEKLEVSCLNGPQDTVLGGKLEDVEAAAEILTAGGVKNSKLALPYAFHTQQIDAIIEPFTRLAEGVSFASPKVTFISTLTGAKLTGEISPEYLTRHARESVRFVDAINSSRAAGIIDDSTIFLEIGPHPICTGMVKSTLGSSYPCGSSLRKGEDFYRTVTAAASMLHSKGVSLNWNEYHSSFKTDLRPLRLPAYAFDEKNYWIQYTGDWCLNKNAPHPLFDGTEKAKALEKDDNKSPIDTTTIHKVLSEKTDDKGQLTMVTETDISREDTLKMASGHQVNGAVLLSSTVLADMAATVGQYIEKKYRKSSSTTTTTTTTEVRCNIGNMTVHKPYIANPAPTGPQILHLTTTMDLAGKVGSMKFSSISGTGKKTEHAHCTVEFGDPAAWRAEWSRVAYLVEGRVQALQAGVADGKCQKLTQRMAYKLFSALVDYGDAYCGMREVTLNSDDFEATAKVRLAQNPEGHRFVMSPYYIDSCSHISGFTVNGSDATDSNSHVYISHGWESLRFAEDFDAAKTYRSYVRMMPTGEGNMRAGDVYIFDEAANAIVGCCGGVRFQQIPRHLLNIMLPPTGSKKAMAAAAAAPAATTAPVASKPQQQASAPVEEKSAVSKAATATPSASAIVGSVIAKTLDIIAEEMGIGVDELDDPINFADMGCDSLMSLSISGRMREEMDVDVESHIFVDHPTVGQLKTFLKQFETGSPEAEATASEESSSDSSTLGSGSASPTTPASTHGSMAKITDIDLNALNRTLMPPTKHTVVSTTEIPPTPVAEITLPSPVPTPSTPTTRPHRVATSVLLQGSPRRASKTMWVMPDGGGSATSYMGIPKLSDDVAVYGLNSPYMKTPEEYTLGLTEISTKFVAEIMRKQPHGPYTLAGWSAGGVVAYEACQQLIALGETVEKLLLIDSPCPTTIEALPPHLHPFFNEIGLLGDGLREASKVPSWLLPHFRASVTALSTYDSRPLPSGKTPKTLAIWCTDGVCKEPEDPRPSPYPDGHALFLLENRADFGPNEWDSLMEGARMQFATVPGNHFTMMRSPNVELLGNAMRDFMTSP